MFFHTKFNFCNKSNTAWLKNILNKEVKIKTESQSLGSETRMSCQKEQHVDLENITCKRNGILIVGLKWKWSNKRQFLINEREMSEQWTAPPSRRGAGGFQPTAHSQLSSEAPEVPSGGLHDKTTWSSSHLVFLNHWQYFNSFQKTTTLVYSDLLILLFLDHRRTNNPEKTLSCKSKILLKLHYFTGRLAIIGHWSHFIKQN